MNQGFVITTILLGIIYTVKTNNIPIYNIQNGAGHHISTFPLIKFEHSKTRSKYEDPYNINKKYNSINDKAVRLHNLNRINTLITDVQPLYRRILMTGVNMNPIHGRIHPGSVLYPIQGPGYTSPNFGAVTTFNVIMNNPYSLQSLHSKATTFSQPLSSMNAFHQNSQQLLQAHAGMGVTEAANSYQILSSHEKFSRSLDHFERKFYKVTFNKLTSISPVDRRTNGMSFVQSGFFLQLILMALSLEVDATAKAEIDRALGLRTSEMETINIIRDMMSALPESSEKLKFRRASRLMLWPGREVSQRFRRGIADVVGLDIDNFNGTETPSQMTTILNQKIETESGGAIRDTFDEDDLAGTMAAILTTTLYYRARWRTAPTVLNGTKPFHDADDAPKRTVRMIKLNDIMGYADIKEWNAEALEIPYAASDLSLLMLIPRTPALRRLAEQVMTTSVSNITSKMRKMRIAATIPLYTLRMTLLLPNKLQDMGINRLFNVDNLKPSDKLRLSHMVQRLMFWAEAGRNAFKDDGIDWEETPELNLLVDRPYIFFVRWRNLTLMNGNFVL